LLAVSRDALCPLSDKPVVVRRNNGCRTFPCGRNRLKAVYAKSVEFADSPLDDANNYQLMQKDNAELQALWLNVPNALSIE
jgi:hypothetical protein